MPLTLKITDNGVFTGYLKFDFKYANSNTVDVNEDFNEAKVHVKIKNGEQLSRSSLKVKLMIELGIMATPKYMVLIRRIKILQCQQLVKLKVRHLKQKQSQSKQIN